MNVSSFGLTEGSRVTQMKSYYVYMLANKKYGVLYIGVTSDLIRRIYEHKNDLIKGFTNKYNTHDLVYYEIHTDIHDAIKREKRLKAWNRMWKVELIDRFNPEWRDLYMEIAA